MYKVAQGAKIRGASRIIGVDTNPEKSEKGSKQFISMIQMQSFILLSYVDSVNFLHCFASINEMLIYLDHYCC